MATKTETINSLRNAGYTEMADSTLRRKTATELETLLANVLEGSKTGDLAETDTDCGGCENGECDGCGNYTCCDDDSALGRTSYESKVGTKWTYIYMNGELIAEVRNDAAKQVMAVLQASA